MRVYLYIALGGALGASARYLLSGLAYQVLGGLFPWGTFLVNLLGSFALGWFYEAAVQSAMPPELRLFVAVGLLGAFTTFSTLSYEGYGLLREGQGLLALVYTAGSLVLGLLAVALGVWAAGR